ncbi:MAG: bifunctional ADP-heptose synthase [Acidobacteriota bacterium]|nr:bifunctional ADP-heptose synthase [Acidobacteriota bacterium]
MEARVKNSLECIRRISGARVLVVGDVMLDTYLSCRALGVADEAPVPLLEIRGQSQALGGAANVARNLARLGARTALVGMVGGDSEAAAIKGLLRESGVEGSLLETRRPTTLKTRVLSGDHYYLRLDEEELTPLTEAEQAALAARIEAQLSEVDLLVVSDYDKGLLSPSLAERIERLAREGDRGIVADLKPRNALNWRHLDLIAPNLSEARSLCAQLDSGGEPGHDVETIAETLRSRMGCAVVLKMGSRGMLIAPPSGPTSRLDALCPSPVEVSGAGDTVLATLAAALAQGADLHQAARLANLAASISVSRPGTHAVSAAELTEAVTQSEEAHGS